MSRFLAELLGTMILILLGDGVVANACLNKTKGHNSDWMVITTAWAFAVAVPVYIFGTTSGAHFNPAVTIGLAVAGAFPWNEVIPYIVAQFIGAIIGAVLVYITYRPHWSVTDDPDAKLGCFCTIPAIRDKAKNAVTEIVGTFVLVFGILGFGQTKMAPGLSPFVVGILIWAIGLSLGGPTGYAINPARDIGPRIAHAFLPIPGKRDSDWGYSWVPGLMPIVGGVLAALFYNLVF